MKKLLFSLLALVLSCCAVNAQGVPGLGMGVPVNGPGVPANLNSSSDPTANSDSTQGYQVGSIWQNSATGRIWVARSVSAGAAVWSLLELGDHPGYIANFWAVPAGISTASAGAAPGLNSIRLFPAYIKQRITISSLGVRVTTVSAGGNVQAAIYAHNASTGRPTGSALASTASMSTASAASVNASVSVQLNPGIYWFATNCDNGTAIFDAIPSTNLNMSILIGSTTQANSLASAGGGLNGLSVSQTFGTWPDLTAGSFTEVTGSSSIPIVQFLVGSIP